MVIRDSTTNYNIDSVVIEHNAVIKKGGCCHFFSFELNYAVFKNKPTITVFSKGIPKVYRLEYDWDKWFGNFNPEYLVYDYGIVKRKE